MSEPDAAKEIVIDGDAAETAENRRGNAEAGPNAADGKKAASRRDGGGRWLIALALLGALGAAGWQLYAAQDRFNTLFARTYAHEKRLNTLSAAVQTHERKLAQLQQGLETLREDVEALSTEVDALNGKVLDPANDPLVTKGDLDRLQRELDGLQGQLQTWAEKWRQALSALSAPTQTDRPQDKPADEPMPPAVERMQRQLNAVASQLQRLFQTLTQTPAKTAEATPEPPPSSSADSPAAAPDPIAEKLPQWATAINTQWLLTRNVALARAQLHALEQAISASDLPQSVKSRLIHVIGEDSAYLKQFGAQRDRTLHQALQTLRQRIAALTADALRLPEETASNAAEPSPADEAAAPAWQRILKDVVQVRRRSESAPPLGPLDRALLHALLQQRALLLSEHLQWAADTQRAQAYRTSLRQLQTLLKRYYPESGLQPPAAQFPQPRPLKLIEAL